MPDKKNSTVQIMRGIAIVAVLFWHSISQVKTDAFLKAVGQIIICFHMPVFFAIAGNLFEKSINKYINMGRVRFIKKKAKHLLIPYVFWTVLLWGCINIVELLFPSSVAKLSSLGYAPMDIKNLIWGLLTYEVYYTQHLWFVYVLFVLFAINILLLKTGRGILIFVTWLLLGFLTRFVTLPDIIERIMVWGCFFCFGRMIARRPQLTSKSIGGGGVLDVDIDTSLCRNQRGASVDLCISGWCSNQAYCTGHKVCCRLSGNCNYLYDLQKSEKNENT